MASANEDFANFDQFQIDGRPVTKLKVDELKQELITRGLEKTGLKKELQERLCQALANEKNSTEDKVEGSAEEKPVVDNGETSNQEVSSTTDVKEEPLDATVVKESNGQDESQVKEEKDDSVGNEEEKNDEEKNDEEKNDKKSDDANMTEGKRNETEEVEDGEIIGQEDEKKEEQKPAVPEKRRRISLQRDKSNNPPTPGTRKRKWSSNKPKSSVVITTDSLKELIPGVQLASTPALEAVMELDDDKDDEEEGKNEKQQEDKEQENEKNSYNKLDEKSPYKRRIVQVADSKTVKLGQAINEAEPDVNEQNDVTIVGPTQPSNDAQTGAGSLDDNQSSGTPPSSATATPVKREVSPPRNPPSCSVHVSNLVRPFTQKQLMQHLSQFGAVTDEGFWMNKIKSHCYVTYSSVDEATNARQSLHGQRWPTTSPRTLRVDFAVNQKMLEDTDGALGKKIEEIAEKKKEKVDDGKERSRSKEKSSRKHKEKKEEKKKEEPSAANLLDKLFRKTTALPSIYWLPLTNEQIVLREKEREERRKQRQLTLQQEKQSEEKPRDATRKPPEREKPRETQPPKAREMPRDQNRRPPPRDNRPSSPPARQRPERRPSPVKRRSRSPPFRRAADRRR